MRLDLSDSHLRQVGSDSFQVHLRRLQVQAENAKVRLGILPEKILEGVLTCAAGNRTAHSSGARCGMNRSPPRDFVGVVMGEY